MYHKWSNLFAVPNTCSPNPCKNGGICHDGECLCPIHCGGKHCENCRGESISDESIKSLLKFHSILHNHILINEFSIFTYCILILGCDPNPCKNGGTCKKGACTCPPDTTGPECEYKIGKKELCYIMKRYIKLFNKVILKGKIISLWSRIFQFLT